MAVLHMVCLRYSFAYVIGFIIAAVGFMAAAPAAAQPPPSNLVAVPGNARVTVSWSPPALDPDETIVRYTVYRATAWLPEADPSSVSVEATQTISDPTATSFVDTGLNNETTYFYRMTAHISEAGDVAEESTFSPPAVATPSAPPAITLTAPDVRRPAAVTAGEAVTVEATIEDPALTQALLFWRAGGAARFTSTPLSGSGNTYTATIPAADVSPRGLELYVTATDTAGVGGRTPSEGFHATPVATDGLSTTQGGGSAQTAFRILALPLDLDAADLGEVLEDDLGPPAPAEWRLFTISPNGLFASDGGYDAVRTLDRPVQPGDAFWLITRTSTTVTTGSGTSVPTDEPFSIPLQSGWNLIGLPYAFDLPLSAVTVTNSSASLNDVLAYTGEFVPVPPSGTLTPFRGYLVRLSDGGPGTLVMRPGQPVSASEAPSPPITPRLEWQIDIAAHVQDARDTYNTAGVSAAARAGWDPLDRFEPPPIGEYVAVAFPPADRDAQRGAYRRDIRPPAPADQTWRVDVRSTIADVVTLTFDGLDTLPDGTAAWLVDETTEQTTLLTPSTRYRFQALPDAAPRPFRLVVGPADALRTALDTEAAAPDRVELVGSYPNPAPHSATIRYGLPSAMPVTLAVYDVLGRRVAVLQDGRQERGYHTVHWTGRTAQGTPVSSGTYLYRLEAGNTVRTGRLVIVR